MATTASAEPIRSQEPGTTSRVSHMGAGSQSFGPSLTAFPDHRQEAGWESGAAGLEPASIWDLGVQGEDLNHCAIAPGPNHLLFKKNYLFLSEKADIQRGEETERKIFHPMIHSPNGHSG